MRTAVLPLLFVIGCGCNGGGGGGGDDDTIACDEELDRTGEGTYYDADGSGACSFDPSPGDLMVAAANPTDFAGSAACGACAEVDGPNGSVTVRIVDLCPGCAAGDLDLSQEAFAEIAEIAAGRVPITWRYVPCDVTGDVVFHWKDGSNAFWAAIQVRNHLHRIVKLEARKNTDTAYLELPRESYNYFIADGGFGDGLVDVRITDVYGHVLDTLGIAQGDDIDVEGMDQLSACR